MEAEDKILGPLTFKEFIYFMIGFGWAALTFAIFRTIIPAFIIIGLPPTFFFLMLAFFHRDGQSFEQILVALLQFFAASRRRTWRKNDEIETFHVESAAPVMENTQRNPAEVRSELEKLAHLIDSRGWNHPPEADTTMQMPFTAHADRIVPTPPPVPHAPEDIPTDILDLQKSPMARNLAELLEAAAADVRVEAMQRMTNPTAIPAAPAAVPAAPSISGVTPAPLADIINLATKSDELKVSQIAAQASRAALPGSPALEVTR
ncbi:MAG: hypothetical protein NVSMB39_1650 [Candidatus Saccharimonadales bacterium]